MSGDRLRNWTIVIVCGALLLVLRLHLVAALFAGLLVHELVHVLAPRLAFGGMRSGRARLMTVGLIATLVIAALTAVVLGIFAALRSEAAGPTDFIGRLADIIESARASLPAWIAAELPADPGALRERLLSWTREHANQVQQWGASLGRAIGHIVFGTVIGAIVCLREARGPHRAAPLVEELEARLTVLARAFRSVVFAQVKISAVNTALTAIYLMLVLPMVGVQLPLRKTMIAITFAVGLLPIIGNLISNTLIVIVSLSASGLIAAASLVFLILLHKFEYLLNARIVGLQIKASAWEILSAMLILEAAFGVTGLIAAPIFYAYIKDELKDLRLI